MACYESADNNTHIGIIINSITGYTISTLKLNKSDTSLMTIYYPDGTTDSTSSSGSVSFAKTFAEDISGYITIECSGDYNFTDIFGSDSGIYESIIDVVLTNNITSIGSSFLFYADRIKTFTANNIIDIDSNFLYNNTTLVCLCLPNCTSIGSSLLRNNFSINYISLPNCVTVGNSVLTKATALIYVNFQKLETASYTFILARSVKNITFDNLLSVADNFMSSASSLEVVEFNMITPPTVSNSAIFSSLPAYCVIKVPQASLTAYQTTTNLTQLADYMVGV